MGRLTGRPIQRPLIDPGSRFEKFHLTENPFPSEPFVNKDSTDRRINGDIFEIEIRRKEYDQIKKVFLLQTLSNPNHLRLGYIIDTSYIGRGNGKSAFLVNLQNDINREYCLDISGGLNKCFAAYVSPEPGGKTKTFASFVDSLFQALVHSGIIEACLATLRLEAIDELYPSLDPVAETPDEDELIENLNSEEWFQKHQLDQAEILEHILRSDYLQDLPDRFPLLQGRNTFIKPFVSRTEFERHYFVELKRGKERLDFVFSQLIRLFQAASFNGAYILVDDYERIPDFQSARQKRDFALELRSCLFDGAYANARLGFYTFFLVLHAGVPRLISDAWAESGMENRAPISPIASAKHIIPFEKLSTEHVSLLLKRYLKEYRTPDLPKTGADDQLSSTGALYPFTEAAVHRIGEDSEYNAARILRLAYDLLESASEIEGQTVIDEEFVGQKKGVQADVSDKSIPTIVDADSIDLIGKANPQD